MSRARAVRGARACRMRVGHLGTSQGGGTREGGRIPGGRGSHAVSILQPLLIAHKQGKRANLSVYKDAGHKTGATIAI